VTPLHIRGVVLPGDAERDLWVDSSGRISDEPVPDAQTVAVGAFIVPGLVDAHCHVGLDEHGGVDEQEQERQILADRDAGTLLIRDAGVPVDTHWIVGSVVWNSRASVLIATFTTVTSRIDMIAPSTTTQATIISARSSPVSLAAGVEEAIDV